MTGKKQSDSGMQRSRFAETSPPRLESSDRRHSKRERALAWSRTLTSVYDLPREYHFEGLLCPGELLRGTKGELGYP